MGDGEERPQPDACGGDSERGGGVAGARAGKVCGSEEGRGEWLEKQKQIPRGGEKEASPWNDNVGAGGGGCVERGLCGGQEGSLDSLRSLGMTTLKARGESRFLGPKEKGGPRSDNVTEGGEKSTRGRGREEWWQEGFLAPLGMTAVKAGGVAVLKDG